MVDDYRRLYREILDREAGESPRGAIRPYDANARHAARDQYRHSLLDQADTWRPPCPLSSIRLPGWST